MTSYEQKTRRNALPTALLQSASLDKTVLTSSCYNVILTLASRDACPTGAAQRVLQCPLLLLPHAAAASWLCALGQQQKSGVTAGSKVG